MTRDSSDFGVVGIVIVEIIEELCCNHNAGDEQPMNVQRVDDKCLIPLDDAINVDESYYEAVRATGGILENPFQIFLDTDARRLESVKHRDVSGIERKLIISENELVQDG